MQMVYELKRLAKEDGSWDVFYAGWAAQCVEVNDDIADFATSSLPVLEDIAAENDANTYVVGLFENARCLAVAMVNRANIPGPPGWTLRVRHVVACPLLDFGALSETLYAEMLVELTLGIVQLSDTSLPTERVKFHLRSPGDYAYFASFGRLLDKMGVFASCTMHGAWLHIEKGKCPSLALA